MQPPYERKAILTEATVVSQEGFGDGCFAVRIHAPQIVRVARPGEFVMIKGWQEFDPLLPRPFSFARIGVVPDTFDLYYRVVGRGTELMSRWEPGDVVTVLGPLGHAWPIPDEKRDVVIVGRGLGIAPMVCLAEEAARKGLRVFSYLSGRNKTVMLGSDILEKLSHHYVEALDGHTTASRVTEFLEADLQAGRLERPCFYTCGSKRLAVHLQELEKRFAAEAFVSLETHMACGFGACKGCVHPMVDPQAEGGFVYERVCLEGSVFPLKKVLFS